MSSPTPDATFLALSHRLQSRIDNAFDKATGATSSTSATKRDQGPSAPGGFIIDDEAAPGGFLLDDELEEAAPSSSTEHILLSQISHALQLLDLAPDDEDVLAVFRNAAEGWGTSNRGRWRGDGQDEAEEDGRVSRKDWRAVCAALLDDSPDDQGSQTEDRHGEDSESDAAENEALEYEESEGGSSDEYTESPRKRTRASASISKPTPSPIRAKRRRKNSTPSPSAQGKLTARQKATCLDAFLLFFPGVPPDVAEKRRIGLRDLMVVTSLLKEKMKAEEMLEMLEAYSSSPDKTMNLADFQRMMVATRLA
ncbi:hypothetical protein BV25DRAFT_1861652 [Artomyces pyxidatus]|uniref:Uncharacterized protein n=1 Tax=Artomyces pyxidatus TaxID=48021 RepID=A0ACB8SQ43_9AGAM|nr:hypothetical protein BV25DRAFT_1861652 [Artomyces pyxidatus]